MRRALWILVVAAVGLPAQVRFDRDSISVNVDGKPFTVFHYGAESGKPLSGADPVGLRQDCDAAISDGIGRRR
jgi:hypothetical protein